MSAHASAAALAARPAMAGKRISAKSVRCAFDRPSLAALLLEHFEEAAGAADDEAAAEWGCVTDCAASLCVARLPASHPVACIASFERTD